MIILRTVCLLLVTLLTVACAKNESPTVADAKLEKAIGTELPATGVERDNPSFGGVTEVVVVAQGVGETPESAVLKAIDSAVVQVNGRRVGSDMASLESRFRAESSGGSENIRADAFVQAIVSASRGAVTGFKILSQDEIQRVEAERFINAQSQDAGYTVDRSSSRDYEAEGSRSASLSASDEYESSVNGSASEVTRANGGSGLESVDASASSDVSLAGHDTGSTDIDVSASEKMRIHATGEDSLSIDRGANSSSYNEAVRTFGQSYWKVRIEAKVAKYVAPDEKGRPKLAIVMPRLKSKSFAVGDNRIPADDVADEIRTRLSDALTQTKRFIILDREFDDVLGDEVAFIESGSARNQELARIGQQMATDLLLVASVNRFEYSRSSRNLRMSDRQLISYAGGGEVSLKLINATTGEIVMSESFAHELPATKPTTMPRVIDGKALAGQLMDAISGDMAVAVVNDIFPVSVVALTGRSVALSQGGQSVSVGNRYQAVLLGQDLVDPQTGKNLGKMESTCCIIRIDRVAEQTSYGTIEGDFPPLLGTFRPGMIELREQVSPTVHPVSQPSVQLAAAPTQTKTAPELQAKPTKAIPRRVPQAASEKSEKSDKDDDW